MYYEFYLSSLYQSDTKYHHEGLNVRGHCLIVGLLRTYTVEFLRV